MWEEMKEKVVASIDVLEPPLEEVEEAILAINGKKRDSISSGERRRSFLKGSKREKKRGRETGR